MSLSDSDGVVAGGRGAPVDRVFDIRVAEDIGSGTLGPTTGSRWGFAFTRISGKTAEEDRLITARAFETIEL